VYSSGTNACSRCVIHNSFEKCGIRTRFEGKKGQTFQSSTSDFHSKNRDTNFGISSPGTMNVQKEEDPLAAFQVHSSRYGHIIDAQDKGIVEAAQRKLDRSSKRVDKRRV